MSNLEWYVSFDFILYSRNGLHRHKFETKLELTYDSCRIILENNEQDTIKGIIEFETSQDTKDMSDVENTLHDIISKFEMILTIKGYSMKILTKKLEPKCKNCSTQTFSVSNGITMIHNIEGKTKKITSYEQQTLEILFREIFTDLELEKIAHIISNHHEFQSEISDFIYNWIDFNKQYNPDNQISNESTLISKFVTDEINKETCDLLFERNKLCFKKLSQMNIEDKNGKKLSDNLQKILNQSDKRRIICESLLCIYQIRNELFHAGNFEISDLPMTNNFVFDVINKNTLKKFKECNLTSLYDVN